MYVIVIDFIKRVDDLLKALDIVLSNLPQTIQLGIFIF